MKRVVVIGKRGLGGESGEEGQEKQREHFSEDSESNNQGGKESLTTFNLVLSVVTESRKCCTNLCTMLWQHNQIYNSEKIHLQ